MNQLESDLLHNAQDRLRLWCRDTHMRFEAVDLSDAAATAAILGCLIDEAAALCAHLNMSMQDFLIFAQQAYALEMKDKSRTRKETLAKS